MRVAAIGALAAALLIPGLAAATEPSVIATDGASAWSYRDASDLSRKREGGYLQYDAGGSFYSADGSAYDTAGGWVDQSAFAGKGPHGGYDTSTNKCKACHAVHRAEGGAYLLRGTSVDDACDYCHVGGSAHSATIVYDSGADGKYTGNGHTIGSGSFIPASTVSMETSITVVERDGIEGPSEGDLQVPIRLVQTAQKKLYRIVGRGWDLESRPSPDSVDSTAPVFAAIGPTPLSCSGCHQVHNSRALTWSPTAFSELDSPDESGFITGGYKLLRRFPGASAAVPQAYLESGEPLGTTMLAKVPESLLATGFNYSETVSLETTYTEAGVDWRQPDWIVAGGFPGGAQGAATVVNQYTLSVWCADCHNLAIGGSQIGTGYPEPGPTGIHGKATHPVPGTAAYGGATGGFQCYSCHRGDLDYGSSCSACHYSAASYRARVESVGTDFPHSASEDGYKLLGNYSWVAGDPESSVATGYVSVPIGPDNLGAVCLRCHNFAEGEHPSGTGNAHLIPDAYAECMSCHAGTDAAVLHIGVPAGCQSCHSAPTLTVDCALCHAPQLEPHGYIAADHQAAAGSGPVMIFADFGHDDAAWTGANAGAPTPHFDVDVECAGCHSSDLGGVHDGRCSACHSGLVESLGTWNGTCSDGGCHPTYHAESTVAHEPWEDPYYSGINCYLCHDPSGWWPTQAGCANCHLTNNPVDTTPPVTSSNLLPTYLGPALIDFSISDSGKVGVGTAYSRLDGGPAVAGDTRFVTVPGAHTLEFWSVDQYGNVEASHTTESFVIVADIVAPVTTSNAQSIYYSGTTITLSPSDASTLGVKSTYYTLNGGPQQTGTSVAIPPTASRTIAYTLVYWSVDWTGNVEAPKTATFSVVGGTRIIRLTWGDSDLYGLDDPNADAYWTIRRGSATGTVVATGAGSWPTWDGSDDYAVPISSTPYYVEVWWWNTDFDDYDLSIWWPLDISTGGDPIRLRY